LARPVTFQPGVEFLERLDLDLAHTLAGEPHVHPDLFKRERLVAVEAVTQPQDLGFAVVDGFQQLADGFQVVGQQHLVLRAGGACVRDHLAEHRAFALGAAAGLAGAPAGLHGLSDDAHLLGGQVHLLGQLLHGGGAAQLLFEQPRGPCLIHQQP